PVTKATLPESRRAEAPREGVSQDDSERLRCGLVSSGSLLTDVPSGRRSASPAPRRQKSSRHFTQGARSRPSTASVCRRGGRRGIAGRSRDREHPSDRGCAPRRRSHRAFRLQTPCARSRNCCTEARSSDVSSSFPPFSGPTRREEVVKQL